jgi:glutaredoxin
VRRALEARGASYAEIDVAARPERVPELVKLTRGRRVVPVVVGSGGIEIAPGGGSEF